LDDFSGGLLPPSRLRVITIRSGLTWNFAGLAACRSWSDAGLPGPVWLSKPAVERLIVPISLTISMKEYP
jgi:hypothetical protein